jgi:hypothetical protein
MDYQAVREALQDMETNQGTNSSASAFLDAVLCGFKEDGVSAEAVLEEINCVYFDNECPEPGDVLLCAEISKVKAFRDEDGNFVYVRVENLKHSIS